VRRKAVTSLFMGVVVGIPTVSSARKTVSENASQMRQRNPAASLMELKVVAGRGLRDGPSVSRKAVTSLFMGGVMETPTISSARKTVSEHASQEKGGALRVKWKSTRERAQQASHRSAEQSAGRKKQSANALAQEGVDLSAVLMETPMPTIVSSTWPTVSLAKKLSLHIGQLMESAQITKHAAENVGAIIKSQHMRKPALMKMGKQGRLERPGARGGVIVGFGAAGRIVLNLTAPVEK